MLFLDFPVIFLIIWPILLYHFYIKDRTGRPGLRKRGKYNSVKNSDDGDACNVLEISPEQASSDIDKEFVDRTERGMCTFIYWQRTSKA